MTRRSKLIARALIIISATGVLVPLLLVVLDGRGDLPSVAGDQLPFLGYGFVGYVLATLRPKNPIGWLFLCIGLGAGMYTAVRTTSEFLRPAPEVSGALFAATLALNGAGLALLFFVLLLFPDGRLPSPRWRMFAWWFALVIVIDRARDLLSQVGPPSSPNPLFVAAVQRSEVLGVTTFFVGVSFFGILLSPALRWLHGTNRERSQLKWLASTGLLYIGAVLTGFFSGIAGSFLIALLPAAVGIAILRHGLFDIDFVVNRAVLYGIVAFILVAAFEVFASVIEQAIGPEMRERLGFIRPLTGLAVLPAFRPLERRVRPLVDRFLPAMEPLALLFTDIVGSTEVTIALGDTRWRQTQNRYYAAVRRELRRYRGTEVDTAGDGVFATFRDAVAAVRCGLALVPAVRELGLASRIGLHFGECEMRGDKPTGTNVNLAARVMTAADPDAVLVSKAFRDEVAKSGVVLEPLGPRVLKGIPDKVVVYRAISALP